MRGVANKTCILVDDNNNKVYLKNLISKEEVIIPYELVDKAKTLVIMALNYDTIIKRLGL